MKVITNLEQGMLVEISNIENYKEYSSISSWAETELISGEWIYISDKCICMWYQDVPEEMLRTIEDIRPFDSVLYGNDIAYCYGTQAE